MKTLTNGNRIAKISPLSDGWTVWVGYTSPSGEEFGALYFKGCRTCGNTYKTEKAAIAAAEKFLTKK